MAKATQLSRQDGEPLSDLTAFKRDLLAVIHGHDDGQLHGLGIKAVLDDAYGGEVNHGRLYPCLNELAAAGLVEKGAIDDRTNRYSLTADGERALAAHLRWQRMFAGDLVAE